MMKKLLAAFSLSSVSLLLGTSVVLAASGDSSIIKNGAGSHNTIVIKKCCSTWVSQKNSANFGNGIEVVNSTGGNKANKNTNGDVTTTSGNSTTNIGVANTANMNTAEVTNCCCCASNLVDPLISDNGAGSVNKITIKSSCSTSVKQKNTANIENNVEVVSSTGGNTANKNTGGNVDVTSGSSNVTVNINNTANSNSLTL